MESENIFRFLLRLLVRFFSKRISFHSSFFFFMNFSFRPRMFVGIFFLLLKKTSFFILASLDARYVRTDPALIKKQV